MGVVAQGKEGKGDHIKTLLCLSKELRTYNKTLRRLSRLGIEQHVAADCTSRPRGFCIVLESRPHQRLRLALSDSRPSDRLTKKWCWVFRPLSLFSVSRISTIKTEEQGGRMLTLLTQLTSVSVTFSGHCYATSSTVHGPDMLQNMWCG